MRAVRDSETAAESVGINPLVVKTVAFAVSAAAAPASPAALFAPLSGFVTPSTFGFGQSILFVLVVMIGGAGSVAGPLVGALVVGAAARGCWPRLEEYRLLFFGALLLVVLWVAPDGAIGLCSALAARRRRERSPRAGDAVAGIAAARGAARRARWPHELCACSSAACARVQRPVASKREPGASPA